MRASMAMVDFPGVYKVTAKGRVYYYAWKGKGAPRLKGEPGSVGFAESLEAATARNDAGAGKTIAALCARYRAAEWWKMAGEPGSIAVSTKKNWSPWIDKIETYFGKLSIAAFDRPAVRQLIRKWRNQWRDTPRTADYAKQVLSAILTFAVDEGDLAANPCIGIKNLYSNDRADIIWTADDLATLAKTASAPVMAAARLAALTGLRQTDLLRLPWSRVGALAIEVKTGKGRGKRTALIPMYAELRDYLATIPKVGAIVLTNGDGLPWKSGFGSSWNKALIKAAIKDLHFHDLRGTAATRMYLGELSLREIAQIMAWSEEQVERLINVYVNRDALLRDRIRRMDENTARTTPEKLGEKPG